MNPIELSQLTARLTSLELEMERMKSGKSGSSATKGAVLDDARKSELSFRQNVETCDSCGTTTAEYEKNLPEGFEDWELDFSACKRPKAMVKKFGTCRHVLCPDCMSDVVFAKGSDSSTYLCNECAVLWSRHVFATEDCGDHRCDNYLRRTEVGNQIDFCLRRVCLETQMKCLKDMCRSVMCHCCWRVSGGMCSSHLPKDEKKPTETKK